MKKDTSDPRYQALGFGVGLRAPHLQYILEHKPPVDWFEVVSENCMTPGGIWIDSLQRIRECYPCVMHGVSLSIGNTDPLNTSYLQSLKQMMDWLRPAWVSDHLCWTGTDSHYLHDLLPLPYTEEAVRHVVERVAQVQDFLGQRIALENVSSYITYQSSEMTEWEFLTAVAEESDCLILLDLNNVYVSAYNHQFDPLVYLDYLPPHRIQQLHLAGHTQCDEYIIDTHDAEVIAPVWALYQEALKRFGAISLLIERDDQIPPFETLMLELEEAKKIACDASGRISDTV